MRKVSQAVADVHALDILKPEFVEVRTHGLGERVLLDRAEKPPPRDETALTLYAINHLNSNEIFHRRWIWSANRRASSAAPR